MHFSYPQTFGFLRLRYWPARSGLFALTSLKAVIRHPQVISTVQENNLIVFSEDIRNALELSVFILCKRGILSNFIFFSDPVMTGSFYHLEEPSVIPQLYLRLDSPQ